MLIRGKEYCVLARYSKNAPRRLYDNKEGIEHSLSVLRDLCKANPKVANPAPKTQKRASSTSMCLMIGYRRTYVPPLFLI